MAKSLILIGLLAISFANFSNSGQITPAALQQFAPRVAGSLEWVALLFKRIEQLSVPYWAITHNANQANRWSVVFANLSISGPSKTIVKSVIPDPRTNTIIILATVPKISIKSKYSANGVTEGKQVHGKGNVEITVSNIDVMAKLNLRNPWNKIKVDSINLSYTIGNLYVDANNLKLDGTLSFLVNRRISSTILDIARKDIPRVSKVFSDVLKSVINAYVTGTRMAEAFDWARKLVTGRL